MSKIKLHKGSPGYGGTKVAADGTYEAPKKSKEAVVHPEHYNKGIEVITFIESWDLNFSRGSAVKYICRGGLKDPEKEIEDLQKAQEYIQFEIERIKRESNKSES